MRPPRAGAGRRRLRALLDERVPRAAVGAAAEPLRRLRAALLADEHGLRRFASIWSSGNLDRIDAPRIDPIARYPIPTSCVDPLDPRCRCGRRSPTGSCRSCAAISRTSMRSSPCAPMITTSSPGDTSRPVTSAISMSMQTEPTIGARRPRISTDAAAGEPQVEAVGIAGRARSRSCVGRSAVNRAP